jgi:hypothetical protein
MKFLLGAWCFACGLYTGLNYHGDCDVEHDHAHHTEVNK